MTNSNSNSSLPAKIGVGAIKTYQAITHPVYSLLPFRMCSLEPSCSEYTKQAIEKYGLSKGTLMGLERIFFRCRPGKVTADPLK